MEDRKISVRDAIGFANKFRFDIDHATRNFGAACTEYGKALCHEGEDPRDSYTEMLRAHAAIDRAWSKFFQIAQEHAQEPQNNG